MTSPNISFSHNMMFYLYHTLHLISLYIQLYHLKIWLSSPHILEKGLFRIMTPYFGVLGIKTFENPCASKTHPLKITKTPVTEQKRQQSENIQQHFETHRSKHLIVS